MPAAFSEVTSEDDELEPGSVVDNRYRIVARLGGGAMGTVYRAEHIRVGREVAIKVLARELTHDQDLRRRFEVEARAAAAAGHPGIVQILDAGTLEDGSPYLVMEHLRGRDLYSHLLEEGAVSIERAVKIVRDLARAIHAAHEVGVVHRDLKPENIYVVESPEGEATKVIDFGVAFRSEMQPSRLTRPGIVVGTPHYMAPELLDGSTPTHTADIYGMGAILYELVTRQPPHDADSVGALLAKKMSERPTPLIERRKDVPRELSDLVDECLAVDPTLRPATARALADRLDAILVGTALPNTVPVEPLAPERRSALLPIAIAVMIAAIVVLAVFFVAGGKSATPFAEGLASRERVPIEAPGLAAPRLELALVAEAEAEAEPDPAPEPEVATTIDPVVPTPGKREGKRGSTVKEAPVSAEICDRDRERARNARNEHDWGAVLTNTARASCWKNDLERRRMQVKAYMELGRFAQCIARGKGSNDPEVQDDVKLCERRKGGG